MKEFKAGDEVYCPMTLDEVKQYMWSKDNV